MNAIVPPGHFERVATPLDILPKINPLHSGTRMLRHLCRAHPTPISRHELMTVGGFCQYDLSGPAAFEWWILRINDHLPWVGWYIVCTSEGAYRLETVADRRSPQ